jgi:hypothetical protein
VIIPLAMSRVILETLYVSTATYPGPFLPAFFSTRRRKNNFRRSIVPALPAATPLASARLLASHDVGNDSQAGRYDYPAPAVEADRL